ncbi:MAG TPA: DUF2784 domain-containing protein [Fimbriimonadaceae bacterium]|nr:DUF2784 domain-containing protein [Fimbriimonadaceae bacterium]
MLLLRIADVGLFAFHTLLVLFNCVGWIWPRTRRLHLATLGATAASWFLLGIWFGPGYCLCTDLHWRIRAALGENIQERTYIQYLVSRITGWTPNAELASNATAAVFVVVAILSLWLNLRDLRRARGLKRAIH